MKPSITGRNMAVVFAALRKAGAVRLGSDK
jgi:hypothetical protein